MMRIRGFVLLLASVLILMSSCKDETTDDYLVAEESRYFNLYMKTNYPELDSLSSGLYFKEYYEGTGASPDTGDYVLVNYLAYTIPDEEVVDTYSEDWAIEFGIYNSSVLYGPYKYKHGSEIEGMQEGISMMKEGGVARLIFKSDLGYGADGLSLIDSYESLMYDIELIEVIKDPAQDEKDKMTAYLASVDSYETIYDSETETSMYFIPGDSGYGDAIEDDDEVNVHYTGSLLDGRIFDENVDGKGLELTVGEGKVIDGWELGLKSFKYGESGFLLIPHELAYGEDGSLVQNTVKTSIPPFEALLFEIQVDTVATDD